MHPSTLLSLPQCMLFSVLPLPCMHACLPVFPEPFPPPHVDTCMPSTPWPKGVALCPRAGRSRRRVRTSSPKVWTR
eukprot:364104-Chlamydomonas_euryale.AAC.1